MKKINYNRLIAIIITTFSLIALLGYPSIVNASSSDTVTASLDVNGTLYTSISPNSIEWTNYPTYSNATNTLITVSDKNGNMPGNVFIWGTSSLSYLSNTIAIGNVLWNPTSSTGDTGTSVSTSQVNTNIFVPAPTSTTPTQSNSIYLGVGIPAGTPSGVYTGSIYFDIENGTTVSQPTTSNVLSVSVNVLKVCFINISSTSINFGGIKSGTNTGTNWYGITDTDYGGNVQSIINVEDTNWVLSSNNAVSFSGNYTLYSSTNTGSYTSGTSISSTLTSTGIIVPAPTQTTPSTSNTIYFGVGVPGGSHAGVYTQNIIIANQC
jgi:hypothetical protein